MRSAFFSALGASAYLCLSTFPALAHATLETQQAPVGSTYKGVMRVPHGCEGAPTLKVRIQVPEGVIAVKPMPKAGWTLETVRGPYKQAYDYYGTPMSEGVREISWTGKLLDEHYDEFVFRAYLTGGLPANTTFDGSVIDDPLLKRIQRQWVAGDHNVYIADLMPTKFWTDAMFVASQKILAGDLTGAAAGQLAQTVTQTWKRQNPDMVQNYATWSRDLA
jgi:uncharacterized protein YcnI